MTSSKVDGERHSAVCRIFVGYYFLEVFHFVLLNIINIPLDQATSVKIDRYSCYYRVYCIQPMNYSFMSYSK